jgi:hypothetical protein
MKTEVEAWAQKKKTPAWAGRWRIIKARGAQLSYEEDISTLNKNKMKFKPTPLLFVIPEHTKYAIYTLDAFYHIYWRPIRQSISIHFLVRRYDHAKGLKLVSNVELDPSVSR